MALAEKVADKIVCDETDISEEIIPRMFKVMQRAAEYSCDYYMSDEDVSVCNHLLDCTNVNDRSENGQRTGRPGHD